MNLPPLYVDPDVVGDRRDADGFVLVPIVGGPPELARGDSDPFRVRVGNVDDDGALSLVSNAGGADDRLLQSVVHLFDKLVVEFDGARFAETIAVPVGVHTFFDLH